MCVHYPCAYLVLTPICALFVRVANVCCVLRAFLFAVLLLGAALRASPPLCGWGVVLPRCTALCVSWCRRVCGVLALHMCAR